MSALGWLMFCSRSRNAILINRFMPRFPNESFRYSVGWRPGKELPRSPMSSQREDGQYLPNTHPGKDENVQNAELTYYAAKHQFIP